MPVSKRTLSAFLTLLLTFSGARCVPSQTESLELFDLLLFNALNGCSANTIAMMDYGAPVIVDSAELSSGRYEPLGSDHSDGTAANWVNLSGDGNTVAIRYNTMHDSGESGIGFWERSTGGTWRAAGTSIAPIAGVGDFAYQPDGSLLYNTKDAQGFFFRTDARGAPVGSAYQEPSGTVYVRESGSGLYVVKLEGTLSLYRRAVGQDVPLFAQSGWNLTGLDVSDDGQVVMFPVTDSFSAEIHLERNGLREIVPASFFNISGILVPLAMNAAGTRMAIGTDTGLEIWDISSGLPSATRLESDPYSRPYQIDWPCE